MRIQLSRRRHLLWILGGIALASALAAGLWSGPSVHSQVLVPTAGYGIFSRPTAPGDTPPTDLTEGSQQTRQIATGDASLRQWAVVSGDTLCVQVAAPEGGETVEPRACNSAETLAASQELLVLGIGGAAASPPSLSSQKESIVKADSAPAPRLLVGLAPDGVEEVSVSFADGTTETAPVKANGFHLSTGGRIPTALTWTTAAGDHSQEL